MSSLCEELLKLSSPLLWLLFLAAVRNLPVVKYLGTSTFHHHHHQDVQYNFGFYTSIWDRMFGTHKH